MLAPQSRDLVTWFHPPGYDINCGTPCSVTDLASLAKGTAILTHGIDLSHRLVPFPIPTERAVKVVKVKIHYAYTRSSMNVSRPPRGATVAFRLLGESAPRRPVAWDGLACWAGPDRTADCWMNLDRRDPADPEKGRRGEKCGVGW